jgi:DNA-binding MarR family transcriptional regulator
MISVMEDQREPRWLDAEEQRDWFAFASVLVRLPAAMDAQMQRDSGISLYEYFVLAGLSMTASRAMRMSDLAEFTQGSLSRLSNVAARLEKRGWVRRVPDPADGRYTLAILTDKGWAKVAASAPGHVEEVRRLVFDPLTKAQQRQLRQVCRRILRAIDPDKCSPDDRFRALQAAPADVTAPDPVTAA